MSDPSIEQLRKSVKDLAFKIDRLSAMIELNHRRDQLKEAQISDLISMLNAEKDKNEQLQSQVEIMKKVLIDSNEFCKNCLSEN